ncbi:MAG TPA: RebB family R body protein [Caulobacteraceae bacterium]
MALPTPVNGQITDTVSQTNVTVLGEAPAMALSSLFQASAQSFALMMQNAASAQQQVNITAQAVTTQGVAMLYSIGANSAMKLSQSDVPDNLLGMRTGMRAGPLPG